MDKPFAERITDTSIPDVTPVQYTMSGTSATVSGRVFGADAFPPPIGRYHIQVTGLDPNEVVPCSKIGNGGQVVPEPSSAVLGSLAFLSLFAFGRRRSESPSNRPTVVPTSRPSSAGPPRAERDALTIGPHNVDGTQC